MSTKEIKNVVSFTVEDIRLAIRADTIEIVGNALEEFAGVLALQFAHIDDQFRSFQKQMDDRFDAVDKKFDALDERFEGVNSRFNQVNNSLDAHLLDCVRRQEHDRLVKRVTKVEEAIV